MEKKSGLTYLGFAAVALVFIMLLALIIMFSNGVKERTVQHYSAEAERNFMNTLFLNQRDSERAKALMKENEVDGIAIYGTARKLLFSLGDVPEDLTASEYAPIENRADRGKGVLFNLSKEGKIEFIRSQRTYPFLDRPFDFGDFDNPAPTGRTIDFESTFYIKMNAAGYNRKLIVTDVLTVLVILFVCTFFFFSCRIYLNNLKYKEKISKQATLVSLGEAARTLAHEIKNPLGAIMIQTAVLRKTIPDCREEDIDVIENESRRIKVLTDQIGDFLRNPVGNPVPIDVCSLIASIHPVISPDGNVKVNMDPEKARSVFENLIKNAIETGTPAEDVVVVVEKGKKNMVEIRVSDNGPGFPEDKAEREKLFNAFYTTKVHGSGIGLSICKQFVEAAGGKIFITNREGGGGEVTVVLPMKNEEAER